MSATISGGASSILPDGVRRTPGRRGPHRPEVDPVRRVLELRHRQAVGVGAEAVAERAGAEHEVEHPLGAAARLELGEDLGRVAALDRRAGHRDLAADQRADDEVVPGLDVGVGPLAGGDRGEPQHGLPLLRLAFGRVDHRR